MDDPASARTLGRLITADLSSDGRLLVIDPDGVASVGPVSGGDLATVATDVFSAWFVGETIVMIRDNALVLLGDDGEAVLWESDGDLRLHRHPTVAPTGQQALVPVEVGTSGAVVWIHVDVGLAAATALGYTGWAVHFIEAGRHLVILGADSQTGFVQDLVVVDVVTGDAWTEDINEGISFLSTAWDAASGTLVVDGWDSIYVYDLESGLYLGPAGTGDDPSISPDGTAFVWELYDGSGAGAQFDALVVSQISDPAIARRVGFDCANPEWIATP